MSLVKTCPPKSHTQNHEAQVHLQTQLLILTSCLDGMEISAEKTKLITNNTSGINTEIKVHGQKLETVTSFKYLGSVITDEGSKPEILSRIAQAIAALTRWKPVRNNRSISLISKIRLMRFLVTYIFLHACESWTLTAELQESKQSSSAYQPYYLATSCCWLKLQHIN